MLIDSFQIHANPGTEVWKGKRQSDNFGFVECYLHHTIYYHTVKQCAVGITRTIYKTKFANCLFPMINVLYLSLGYVIGIAFKKRQAQNRMSKHNANSYITF